MAKALDAFMLLRTVRCSVDRYGQTVNLILPSNIFELMFDVWADSCRAVCRC